MIVQIDINNVETIIQYINSNNNNRLSQRAIYALAKYYEEELSDQVNTCLEYMIDEIQSQWIECDLESFLQDVIDVKYVIKDSKNPQDLYKMKFICDHYDDGPLDFEDVLQEAYDSSYRVVIVDTELIITLKM